MLKLKRNQSMWMILAVIGILAGCADHSNDNSLAGQTSVPSPSNAPSVQSEATMTAAPSSSPVKELDKAAFMTIIRELESKNLEIMAAAEKKVLKQDAPAFSELREKLLAYNREAAIKRWEEIYEKNPGWILEPQGLVFAQKGFMLESSFTAEKNTDESVTLQFKTFGNTQYDKALRVTYILTPKDDQGWLIESLQAEVITNAFNQQEALEAVKASFGQAEFEKEDETYYFFMGGTNGQEHFSFHKKAGYTDIVL